MAATATTRLAIFSDSSRPHHSNFLALLPPDVQLEFLGYVESEASTGSGPTIAAARKAAEQGLQGVLVTGAPREVANPTLSEDLQAAVDIPVTTALNAGAAALRAYGFRRALVLTPFDEKTRDGIRDNLTRRGIDATVPYVVGGGPEAMGLGGQTVYDLAHSAWEANHDRDTIYFQGAVLDPLPVIDRLEAEVGKPIIASNPAMLWYVLSKLGRTYHIEGHGRLLSEWPGSPAIRAAAVATQQPITITLDMFTRVHDSLHRVFADVTDDELYGEPQPGMGWLAWRFTRVIDNNISRLSGRPTQLWVGAGWHERFGMEPDPYDFGRGMSHTRAQVEAFRAGRELLLAYHDAVHALTVDYLTSLPPEEFDRELDEPQYQPLPTVSVRLVSVLENAMHNMGQIAYLKACRRLGGWFPAEATGGALYR